MFLGIRLLILIIYRYLKLQIVFWTHLVCKTNLLTKIPVILICIIFLAACCF
jgi:hypothetical protein